MSDLIKPEDFKLETRNDFTLSELEHALSVGPYVGEEYLKNENGGKKVDGEYVPYYNYDVVVGVSLLNEDDVSDSEVFYEGATLQGFGHFEVVASWSLGDGHEMGVILRHTESGRLFRKTGYYSSWDSSDYDGPLEEVEAVEVVSKKYRDITSKKVHDYPLHVKEDK